MSTAETHVANKSKQYQSSCSILQSAKGLQIVLSEALCGGVPKPHMLPREIAVDLLILAPHHERTAAGQAAITEPGHNTLDC